MSFQNFVAFVVCYVLDFHSDCEVSFQVSKFLSDLFENVDEF